MNEIINEFLVARDKFMAERHVRQPGFTYSVCGPFTKKRKNSKNKKSKRFMIHLPKPTG